MARRGENIRKRADGRWEARAIVGYQLTGKPIYKSVYARTYGEVREKKRQLPKWEQEREVSVLLRRVTFGQLMDDWLQYTRRHVKESTYAKYYHMNQVHIAPELGERYLITLTSQDMDDYVEKKLQNGRQNGAGGLCPKTVTDLLVLMKQALRFGQTHGYPCPADLELHYPRQTAPRIQILSRQEQRTLEQAVHKGEDFVGMGIILSLYTGLRIGEVCALRWEDFQYERGTVSVRRTLMRIQSVDSQAGGARTKILIDTPKSLHSVRVIPLPSFLNEYLNEWRRPDVCYFLTGTTSYMEPRNYYRKYKRLMQSCGLGSFNYHALRHTFATRCVEKGFDVKSLSEILGHADVSVTMRRYVHPTLDMKKEQMERLDNGVFRGQINGQQEEEKSVYPG